MPLLARETSGLLSSSRQRTIRASTPICSAIRMNTCGIFIAAKSSRRGSRRENFKLVQFCRYPPPRRGVGVRPCRPPTPWGWSAGLLTSCISLRACVCAIALYPASDCVFFTILLRIPYNYTQYPYSDLARYRKRFGKHATTARHPQCLLDMQYSIEPSQVPTVQLVNIKQHRRSQACLYSQGA